MRRFFAIIGHPVGHSLSPLMHAAAFRELGLDARYVALDVAPERVSRLLLALNALGMDGLNVTVPHKERVLRAVAAAGRIEPAALQIGAVNTLLREQDGWVGCNTDVAGVEQTLRDELRFEGKGKRIIVFGAGGAARAVVWVLARQQPSHLAIVNRTRSKAQALRRWLRRISPGLCVGVAPAEPRAVTALVRDAELLVNATSLGLHAGDPLPVAPEALHKRLRVCDLVYPTPTTLRHGPLALAHLVPSTALGARQGRPEPNRRTTPLVAAARRRGALAVDGVPMLVYQGAASFRVWWHRPAPVEAMRRAVEQALRQRV